VSQTDEGEIGAPEAADGTSGDGAEGRWKMTEGKWRVGKRGDGTNSDCIVGIRTRMYAMDLGARVIDSAGKTSEGEVEEVTAGETTEGTGVTTAG
jgi:hypothetical protein